jgi:carbonic anhydrase/acetyltransferase-like protein (isoleucine patch superfamily)
LLLRSRFYSFQGDVNKVRIGDYTNMQDRAVLSTTTSVPTSSFTPDPDSVVSKQFALSTVAVVSDGSSYSIL